MKKEIKEIVLNNGQRICRVTTADERWYGKEIKNEETGLPEIKWLPSVTWIKSYYYTSPYLIKWIADQGITEADRIKKEAGIKGDKIHQATETIDKGLPIDIIKDKFLNKDRGELEELTADEVEAVLSYRDYLDEVNPEIVTNEMVVFSDIYAGTLDRIYRINGQIWIIDIKTSQSIWKDMIIQLSSYSHADIDYFSLGITDEEWKNRKLAILQLGYQKNKKFWKFTEVQDRYDLFEIAYKTWQEENSGATPKQRDYPLIIQTKAGIEKSKLTKKIIKK